MSSSSNSIPGQPISNEIKINITDALLEQPVTETKKIMYVLHYRKGDNPHPMTKYFFINGDISVAMARARAHCDNMNFRFLRIDPFLSDLEADERRHHGSSV